VNPGVLDGWNFSTNRKEMKKVVHSLVDEVVEWRDMSDPYVQECLFLAYKPLAAAKVNRWRTIAFDTNHVDYVDAGGNATPVKHANCAECSARFPLTTDFWSRGTINDLQRRPEDRWKPHSPKTCITCTKKLELEKKG